MQLISGNLFANMVGELNIIEWSLYRELNMIEWLYREFPSHIKIVNHCVRDKQKVCRTDNNLVLSLWMTDHFFPLTIGFFYLRQNKRLNKQSRRRWFQTPWRSLWRDCNGVVCGVATLIRKMSPNWRNFRQRLYRKLWKWKFSVQLVTKILSTWRN